MTEAREIGGRNFFYGYAHTFERYFEYENMLVDRLKLILTYGLLSREEARKRNIPFRANFETPDLINIICVFPVYNQLPNERQWMGDTGVLLRVDTPVMTIDEVRGKVSEDFKGFWPGAMYGFGTIESKYILAVYQNTRFF